MFTPYPFLFFLFLIFLDGELFSGGGGIPQAPPPLHFLNKRNRRRKRERGGERNARERKRDGMSQLVG